MQLIGLLLGHPALVNPITFQTVFRSWFTVL